MGGEKVWSAQRRVFAFKRRANARQLFLAPGLSLAVHNHTTILHEFINVKYYVSDRRQASRTNTPAAPIPVPMHIEVTRT